MEVLFSCLLGKHSSIFSSVALKLLCPSPENAFHVKFFPHNNTCFALSKSHTICLVVQFLPYYILAGLPGVAQDDQS